MARASGKGSQKLIRYGDPVCAGFDIQGDQIFALITKRIDADAKEVEQRAIRRLVPGKQYRDEEAQAALRPWLEEALKEIRLQAQSRETIGWLMLIRGCLGVLWDAMGIIPAFGQPDKLNVLQMLNLAALQYGRKDNYVANTYTVVPFSSSGLGLPFAGVPDSDILALRRLFHLCVVLFKAEKLYRSVSRGAMIVAESDGTYSHGCSNPDSEKALQYYDCRVNAQYAAGGLFAGVGLPGTLFSTEFPRNPFFCMVPLELQNEDARASIPVEIRRLFPDLCAPIKFTPAAIDPTALQRLIQMPSSTCTKANGLAPRDVIACFHAMSELGRAAYFRNARSRVALNCWGYMLIARPVFLRRVAQLVAERLEVSGTEADTVVGRFLTSYAPKALCGKSLYETSWVHRYMTTCTGIPVVESERAVLLDFVYFVHNVDGWLTKVQIDGTGDTTDRGALFEEWCEVETRRFIADPSVAGPVEKRLVVYVAKGVKLTDVDVTFAQGRWLYVVQCKCRTIDDRHLRGEFRDVWNRWISLETDLAAWDEKMRKLFAHSEWRSLNPRLASLADGCQSVVPLLATPRPEWIPEITGELLAHPGRDGSSEVADLQVCRICTFEDIARLVRNGGPIPATGASWVISL